MSVSIADRGNLFPEDMAASYAAGNTKIEDPDNEKTEDTALDALLEHRAEGEKYIVQEISRMDTCSIDKDYLESL